MLYYKITRISDLSTEDIQNTFELLSEEQKAYLNSLCESRKGQSLAARTVLNALINEEKLGVSISSLNQDKSGKPYFRVNSLYLSLTHSHDFVGCAVSDTPVGIDIEKVKSVKTAVINRVCNNDEKNYIKHNDISSFFTIWTLKEAYIKANGFNCPEIKQINTVVNNDICMFPYDYLTGEISEYKWSIINEQR